MNRGRNLMKENVFRESGIMKRCSSVYHHVSRLFDLGIPTKRARVYNAIFQ